MSNAKIYMLRSNKEAHVLTATDYVKEGELQEYLVRYPYLLPGDQIDPETPRRWLLVAREMGVPGDTDETGRWSLDHLFLDQDGIPTFVECKRATDTRTCPGPAMASATDKRDVSACESGPGEAGARVSTSMPRQPSRPMATTSAASATARVEGVAPRSVPELPCAILHSCHPDRPGCLRQC